MESASIAPALLVAMPQLLDPNFHRTVVLLVQHDGDGSFGVVLNRDTGVSAERLCQGLDLDWGGGPALEVGWGGPVQPQTGWLLLGAGAAPAEVEVHEVAPGLLFAGLPDALPQLAADPPEALRLLLGYAGWGAGQLEAELAQGAWLLAPADPRLVFEVRVEAMWETVLRGLGVEPATLVAGRGVH